MNSKPVSEWSRREVGQLVVACGEAGVPCHDSGITRKRWMGMGQSALLRNSLNTTSRCPEKNSCGLQKGVDTEERKRRDRVSEWVITLFPLYKKLVNALYPCPENIFPLFWWWAFMWTPSEIKSFCAIIIWKGTTSGLNSDSYLVIFITVIFNFTLKHLPLHSTMCLRFRTPLFPVLTRCSVWLSVIKDH